WRPRGRLRCEWASLHVPCSISRASIIVSIRADPFDPDGGALEIDRDDQAICITLDVEDDAIGSNDAGRRIAPLDIRRRAPLRLSNFVKPRVERALHRSLIPVARQA